MSRNHFFTHPLLRWGLILLLSTPTAYLAGAYVGRNGFSVAGLLGILVAFGGVTIILSGERAVPLGFIFWIIFLGLGYRTIPVTPFLTIHPAEVLIWGLIILLLVQQTIFWRRAFPFWLPRWVWLFIPFWLWGWIPGLWSGIPWDKMFAEFRGFLLLVPLAVIASATLTNLRRWRLTLLAFFWTGLAIAMIGVLEFVGVGPSPEIGTDGLFNRYTFAFYGGSIATFVIVLAIPMAVLAWQWAARPVQKGLVLGALTIQIFAVYLGGYRSMWLSLVVLFVGWSLIRRKLAVLGAVTIMLAGAYPLLPPAFQLRLQSLLLILEGHAGDTSGIKRELLAQRAWETALSQPWGLGWSGIGWSHSDFLQIAANLGLIAGAVFFGAYVVTVVRLWRRYHHYPHHDEWKAIGLALLLAIFPVGLMLTTQGVYVLPQLILPVWFIWILAEVWLRQISNSGSR